MLPNRLSASRFASAGGSPFSCKAAARRSRWSFISSRSSLSSCFEWRAFFNLEKRDMTTSLCVAEHAGDAGGETGPALGFGGQLLFAGAGHLIEARAAFILRNGAGRGDTADLFHAVKGRIKRSFIDAERFVGQILDGACDAVPVKGAAAA